MANQKSNKTPAPITNPDVGQRAAPAAATADMSTAKTNIAGSELTADIHARSLQQGRVVQYRYWVGITPSAPVETIHCAGIAFPKVTEQLIADQMRTGQKKRAPRIGALVWLTEQKIRLLRERLPRTVIRFLETRGEAEEPGTGVNIGDVAVRPRRGHLITIPTPEEIADRQKRGKPVRAYQPDPERDVPAARFMFAQMCANQKHPVRGEYYPECLEQTGLQWPEELAGLDDLLK